MEPPAFDEGTTAHIPATPSAAEPVVEDATLPPAQYPTTAGTSASSSLGPLVVRPEDDDVLPGRFPFEPPDEVKRKLRKEDWEAMANAWDAAEADAQAWALFGTSTSDSFYSGGSLEKQVRTKRKKRRPTWNQEFSMLGQDTGRPPPLRRYFDSTPNEASMPKQPLRGDVAKLFRTMSMGQDQSIFSIQHPSCPPGIEEATFRRTTRTVSGDNLEERKKGWSSTHYLTCSVDNPGVHPHFRHYFDTRGLESSYRQRPEVDKGMPKLPSRTSHERPSTREKILRHYSSEAAAHLVASLDGPKVKPATANEGEVDAGTRGAGNIHWGRRCLMHGPDKDTRQAADGSKIPWVSDHHTREAEDNPILNPLLRHYFNSDGLESSFRARGRHYGRPLRAVMGIPPLSTMVRSQSEA